MGTSFSPRLLANGDVIVNHPGRRAGKASTSVPLFSPYHDISVWKVHALRSSTWWLFVASPPWKDSLCFSKSHLGGIATQNWSQTWKPSLVSSQKIPQGRSRGWGNMTSYILGTEKRDVACGGQEIWRCSKGKGNDTSPGQFSQPTDKEVGEQGTPTSHLTMSSMTVQVNT